MDGFKIYSAICDKISLSSEERKWTYRNGRKYGVLLMFHFCVTVRNKICNTFALSTGTLAKYVVDYL